MLWAGCAAAPRNKKEGKVRGRATATVMKRRDSNRCGRMHLHFVVDHDG